MDVLSTSFKDIDLSDPSLDNDNSHFEMDKVLPPELLLRIFSHLSLDDIKNVRLSCKHWREVSLMEPLGTNQLVCISSTELESFSDGDDFQMLLKMGLPIQHLKIVGDDFQMLLRMGFPIQHLKIVGVAYNYNWQFITHFGPFIKTLILKQCALKDRLGIVLSACPNLEVLRFDNYQFEGCFYDYLRAPKPKLKELSIELSDKELSDNALLYLRRLLTNFTSTLTKFKFAPLVSFTPFSPYDEPYEEEYFYTERRKYSPNTILSQDLIQLFKNSFKTLTEIDIVWEENGTDLHLDFPAIFRTNGLALRKVFIEYEDHFEAVFDALAAHQGRTLEEVCITDTSYDAEKQLLKYLSSDLPELKRIRCCDSNSLEDQSKLGLLTLLDQLLKITPFKLEKVDIEGFALLIRERGNDCLSLCQFSSADTEYMQANVLSQGIVILLGNPLCQLTELSLANVDLSENGTAYTIFRDGINLRKLNLKNCHLTDSVLLGEEQDGVHHPVINLQRLLELSLEHEYMLTDLSLSQVIKSPKLVSLSLVCCLEACGPRFSQIALNNPNLTSVKFINVNLTNSAIDEFVRNAPNLVSIDISDNPELTGGAFCQISQHRLLKQIKCG